MNYYYSLDNKPVGPVPLENLHALYRSGVITLDTLIVPVGGTEWKAYSTLNPPPKDAATSVPSEPQASAAPVQPAQPAPAPTAATSFPAASTPSIQSPIPQPGYKNFVLISWILLGVTALISVIPVVGCLTWVMFVPVFIATIVLGILTLSRGGTRDGILILVASIVVLPAFTFLAPIFTTALFGAATGAGKAKITTSTRSTTTTPTATTTTPAATTAVQPAIAQTVENPEEFFKKLDATENGYLSGTEMQDYKGYDTNNDDRVTKEEFVAGSTKDTRLKAIANVLDQFLLLLNREQYDQSFDAASEDFRKDLTKAAYVDNLKKIRGSFGKATDHQLKTIDTKNDLTSGKKTYVVPVASMFEKGSATETVTVVQDADNQYRVADYSLTVDATSGKPASTAKGSTDVPNEIVAKQMINNTLLNFNNAVKAGDFEAFHRTQLSDLWKKEITPERLKKTFQVFIDKKIDLSSIFFVEPVLDPAPHIDSAGLLVLKGHYPLPAQKMNVTFELSYSREAKWGLSGINVKTKPVAP